MKVFCLHLKYVSFISGFLSVIIFMSSNLSAEESSSFGNLFGSSSKRPAAKRVLPKTPSFSEKQTDINTTKRARTYPKYSQREAINRKIARPNELLRSELAQLPQVAVYLSALPIKKFETNLNYLLELKKSRAISLETIVVYDLSKAQAKLLPEYKKWFNKSFPEFQKLEKELTSNDKYYKRLNSDKNIEKFVGKYLPKEADYEAKEKELPLINTLKNVKEAGFKANKQQTLANFKSQSKGILPRLIYKSSKKSAPKTFAKQQNFKKIIDSNGNLISEQLGSSLNKKASLFDKRVSPIKQKKLSAQDMGIVFSFKHYEDELPFWLK